MHEWRFCLTCAAMDADRICGKCLGCDNCCVCNGELVHRQSNGGAFLRRKARQLHAQKEARKPTGPTHQTPESDSPDDQGADDFGIGSGPADPRSSR